MRTSLLTRSCPGLGCSVAVQLSGETDRCQHSSYGAVAVALATATTLVGVTLTAAPASAHTTDASQKVRLAPRTHFTMRPDGSSGQTQGGEGIPNIDSVKKTIATYYGDPGRHRGQDGLALHPEMQQIARLGAPAEGGQADEAKRRGHRHEKPAIVLDADDTTLWTYDMEDAGMQFVFDPALQDVWVQDKRFPATPVDGATSSTPPSKWASPSSG